VTESISTPHALVQTQNGKRFYVNSGIVSVDNTETAVVDIANIGERDIKIKINPILTTNNTDDMTMRLKNNSIIIYQSNYNNQNAATDHGPIHFIIAANTSIQITFQNIDETAHDVGISCYGKYI
jgi:hypothetical protein